FFQLVSIQFIASVLMFLLFNVIFIGLLDIQSKALFFAQSLLILVNIFDISCYFIGIEEIKKTIFRNAFMKVFTTLSILLLIKSEKQLILYSLLNVIGMLIGNLTMVIVSRHYINYKNIKFSLRKPHTMGSIKLLIPRLL